MDDYDSLQDRLDELMDIRQKLDRLNERMEEMDVEWDDLDNEIERCRYQMGAIEEAEREELRREYERSLMYG